MPSSHLAVASPPTITASAGCRAVAQLGTTDIATLSTPTTALLRVCLGNFYARSLPPSRSTAMPSVFWRLSPTPGGRRRDHHAELHERRHGGRGARIGSTSCASTIRPCSTCVAGREVCATRLPAARAERPDMDAAALLHACAAYAFAAQLPTSSTGCGGRHAFRMRSATAYGELADGRQPAPRTSSAGQVLICRAAGSTQAVLARLEEARPSRRAGFRAPAASAHSAPERRCHGDRAEQAPAGGQRTIRRSCDALAADAWKPMPWPASRQLAPIRATTASRRPQHRVQPLETWPLPTGSPATHASDLNRFRSARSSSQPSASIPNVTAVFGATPHRLPRNCRRLLLPLPTRFEAHWCPRECCGCSRSDAYNVPVWLLAVQPRPHPPRAARDL